MRVIQQYPHVVEDITDGFPSTSIIQYRPPFAVIKTVCEQFPKTTIQELGEIIQWTPVHLMCCDEPKRDVIEYLVKQAPEVVQVKDSNNDTLLHLLCNNPEASFNVIQFILSQDPTMAAVRNNEGDLPLECAVARASTTKRVSDLQIVKLLCKFHPSDCLELNGTIDETGNGFAKLDRSVFKVLLKHSKVKTLDVSNSCFTESGYIELMTHCKHSSIQKLKVTFHNPEHCRTMMWTTLKEMLSDNNSNNSMTHLELNLISQMYTSHKTNELKEFGKFFTEGLANNVTLQHLTLRMDSQLNLCEHHVHKMLVETTTIREFCLNGVTQDGHCILEGISQRAANLESLKVVRCHLSPKHIPLLARNQPNLEHLSLLEHDIASVDALPRLPVSDFESLKTLELRYPTLEAKDVIKSLVVPVLKATNLQSLIVDVKEWTTEGVITLANTLRNGSLERLSIGTITPEQGQRFNFDSFITMLKGKNTRLKKVDLRHRESYCQHPQENEIDFCCRLNKAGRGEMRRVSAMKQDLVEAVERAKDDTDIAFAILRESPALWSE